MRKIAIIIFAVLVVLAIVFSILWVRNAEEKKNTALLETAIEKMNQNLSEGVLMCENIALDKISAACYLTYLGRKILEIRETYPNMSERRNQINSEVTKICTILENNSFAEKNCELMDEEVQQSLIYQKIESLDEVRMMLEKNPDAVMKKQEVICLNDTQENDYMEVYDPKCNESQVWLLFNYTNPKNETILSVYMDQEGNIKKIS